MPSDSGGEQVIETINKFAFEANFVSVFLFHGKTADNT